MSFHEINIAIRAENRASFAFRSIIHDVLHMGTAFGLFDSQVGRAVSGVMSMVHFLTSLRAIVTATTTAQQAHNVAVGVQTTLMGASAAATAANTAATGIRAAVTAFAAKVQAVFNSQLAATLVMTGVGIALVLAAAAAMTYFASQTNAAADSMRNFNEEAKRTPRSITRAGEFTEERSPRWQKRDEEESLRNRGIEY